MRFQTESGSVYEVNTDSKQIRRLNGVADPTPRQGKDGEWRLYSELAPDPIQVGKSVLVVWAGEMEPTKETKSWFISLGMEPPATSPMPVTTTSPVVSVETDYV